MLLWVLDHFKTSAGEFISSIVNDDGTLVDRKIREIQIYKDPKTDTGHFKKSHKGWVGVYQNEDGKIYYKDELTHDQKEVHQPLDLLRPVFRNGKLLRSTTFNEIRQRFWNDKF